MPNNLYQSMAKQNNPLEQIAQQARDFRKQFNGDPRQMVQNLLSSGRMSQKTFNELSQIAQMVAQFMGD